MSLFFVTVFGGNIIVSFINNSIQNHGFFSQLTGATYFWFFAGVMAVNAALYYLVTWALKIGNAEPKDPKLSSVAEVDEAI